MRFTGGARRRAFYRLQPTLNQVATRSMTAGPIVQPSPPIAPIIITAPRNGDVNQKTSTLATANARKSPTETATPDDFGLAQNRHRDSHSSSEPAGCLMRTHLCRPT